MSDTEYMEEVKELASKLEEKNVLPDEVGLSLEQVRALLAHDPGHTSRSKASRPG